MRYIPVLHFKAWGGGVLSLCNSFEPFRGSCTCSEACWTRRTPRADVLSGCSMLVSLSVGETHSHCYQPVLRLCRHNVSLHADSCLSQIPVTLFTAVKLRETGGGGLFPDRPNRTAAQCVHLHTDRAALLFLTSGTSSCWSPAEPESSNRPLTSAFVFLNFCFTSF